MKLWLPREVMGKIKFSDDPNPLKGWSNYKNVCEDKKIDAEALFNQLSNLRDDEEFFLQVAWIWIQVIDAFVTNSLKVVEKAPNSHGLWMAKTKNVNKHLSSLTTAKHLDGSPFRCPHCGASKGPGCCEFCIGKEGVMLPWFKNGDMHVCLVADCPVKCMTTALLADHYAY